LLKRAARAGHAPCAARRLRGAAQPARARLCYNVGGVRAKNSIGAWAAGGTRRGRFLWRRAAQGRGRRAPARFVVWLAAAVWTQRTQWAQWVLRRDPGPSSAVQSQRSADRHSM